MRTHVPALLKPRLARQSTCLHLTYCTRSFMILSTHGLFLLACVPPGGWEFGLFYSPSHYHYLEESLTCGRCTSWKMNIIELCTLKALLLDFRVVFFFFCPFHLIILYLLSGAFLVAQMSKNMPANAGDSGLMLGSGRSPGDGNGSPFQYSCLKNPMDRGTWLATVHGVVKSRT